MYRRGFPAGLLGIALFLPFPSGKSGAASRKERKPHEKRREKKEAEPAPPPVEPEPPPPVPEAPPPAQGPHDPPAEPPLPPSPRAAPAPSPPEPDGPTPPGPDDIVSPLQEILRGPPPPKPAQDALLREVEEALEDLLDPVQRKAWEAAKGLEAAYPNPVREAVRIARLAAETARLRPGPARSLYTAVEAAARKAAAAIPPPPPAGARTPGPSLPPAGGDLDAEYASRALALANGKPEDWIALADFAERNMLWIERRDALRRALAADPERAEVHDRLGEVKRNGKWVPVDDAEAEEADEMEARGLRFYGTGWIPADEAGRLRAADAKAAGFDVRVRIDTPFAVVYSAKPVAETRRVTALYANELAAYREFHRGIWEMPDRTWRAKVYLLESHETFVRIYTALEGRPPEHELAGVYLGHRQTLLAGPDPNGSPETDVRISAHELFHAADHMFAPRIGAAGRGWLVEGRAEHFANSVVGRQIVPGAVRKFYQENRWVKATERRVLSSALRDLPLSRLFSLRDDEFRSDDKAGANYVISYAFVHFLFHGDGGKRAEGFRRFLAGLPERASPEAFQACVGRFQDLQGPFEEHARRCFLERQVAERDVRPFEGEREGEGEGGDPGPTGWGW